MRDVTLLDICMRLGMAMLVGLVVGAQRARTYHPAGLRTHMLVCIGACVVMLTGAILSHETFMQHGNTPDPGRLGAQVVSGIGFLGAGTIIKEGFSVRGLTTAASLWAVASLGLAAGMGYYPLALGGMAAIFATLTIFDGFQRRMRAGKGSEMEVRLECEHMSEVLLHMEKLAREHYAEMFDMSFGQIPHGGYAISFRAVFPVKNWQQEQTRFCQGLAAAPGIIRMESNHD